MAYDAQASTLPSIGRLRRYLLSEAWFELGLQERHARLYVKEVAGIGKIEIVLPYAERPGVEVAVTQAMRTLSAVEARSVNEIAASVWSIAFDIIEAVVPTNFVFLQSISLRLAERMLHSSRKLLERISDAESKSSGEASENFISSCKFAHTFSGSFGFRIESLVGPNSESTPETQLIPFERRVLQRFARGLDAVALARAERSPQPILQQAEKGFDSASCVALIELFEETRLPAISLAYHFSKAWHYADDLSPSKKFDLDQDIIPMMREAAADLKSDELPAEIVVIGKVLGLTSRYTPADLLQPEGREITIASRDLSGKEIRYHVQLNPEEYLLAIKAHIDGQEVIVFGNMRRVGRQLRIDKVRQLLSPNTGLRNFVSE